MMISTLPWKYKKPLPANYPVDLKTPIEFFQIHASNFQGFHQKTLVRGLHNYQLSGAIIP